MPKDEGCCTCEKKNTKCPNKEEKRKSKSKEECEEESQDNSGCVEFKNPKRLLSRRAHRVKCFAEMMSDERCFFKFCKRLHIVIGTCLYTWILMMCCLLESIDWVEGLKKIICAFRQNSFLESSLDGLRLVECKMICCMAVPYKPGALWHYFVMIFILPFVATLQIISLKIAFFLKIKNLLFGERQQCPEDEPRMIAMTECNCTMQEYTGPKGSGNNEAGGDAARASGTEPASANAASDEAPAETTSDDAAPAEEEEAPAEEAPAS